MGVLCYAWHQPLCQYPTRASSLWVRATQTADCGHSFHSLLSFAALPNIWFTLQLSVYVGIIDLFQCLPCPVHPSNVGGSAWACPHFHGSTPDIHGHSICQGYCAALWTLMAHWLHTLGPPPLHPITMLCTGPGSHVPPACSTGLSNHLPLPLAALLAASLAHAEHWASCPVPPMPPHYC